MFFTRLSPPLSASVLPLIARLVTLFRSDLVDYRHLPPTPDWSRMTLVCAYCSKSYKHNTHLRRHEATRSCPALPVSSFSLSLSA